MRFGTCVALVGGDDEHERVRHSARGPAGRTPTMATGPVTRPPNRSRSFTSINNKARS